MGKNDNQKVILVDDKDREVGLEDKLKAHQNGARLHRAISIFVFNKKGELLLQQRAMAKYHSPGKWANTCCSHPYPGESVSDAVHRRLREEMGFDCDMREVFSFVYKADVGNGLTEHEYDHVFFGNYDKNPVPDKEEVMDYKWVQLDKLKKELQKNSENFTPWLRIIIDKVISSYGN